MSILEQLIKMGCSTHFLSGARTSLMPEVAFKKIGVNGVYIASNTSKIDEFLKEIQPDLVIYDQFNIEEMYSWKVRQHCPNAVNILDTQDLHFLRHTRMNAIHAGKSIQDILDMDFMEPEVLKHAEYSELIRELASIYRSDMTFVVSYYEKKLLIKNFGVPEDKIKISSFYDQNPSTESQFSFRSREDFVVIGNFKHPPNRDGINWLKKSIWPRIRAQLPEVKVHIFGARPDKIDMELTDQSQGFIVWGPIKPHLLFKKLSQFRVNLAPLRFGAGIKGKISDNWWIGNPTVTTPIGSEGMMLEDGSPWGGAIEVDEQAFANAATRLYTDEIAWKEASASGMKILAKLFHCEKNGALFCEDVNHVLIDYERIRRKNWIGSILWSSSFKYTEAFGKYLELKQTVQSEKKDVR